MIQRTQLFGWTASLLICLAAPAIGSEIDEIDGTATYSGDEKLPEDAVLEVDLIDLTRQSERGRILSRMRFSPDDGVPIQFTLSYDPKLIARRGTYTLVARIVDGTDILYRSTAIVPVLIDDLDPQPEIEMEKVKPVITGGSPVGHKWRVVRIDGVEPFGFTKMVIEFAEDGSMSGNAGCNKFKGTYKIDGDKLDLGEPMRTKRGCQPDIMDREKDFVLAVRRVERYERDEDVLYLMDIDGLEAMRLERE
ncbi:META domain-containing protein [Rhodobacteraceae bacterium NNCM2]|nr:META domain-containing protein [Coraliihabitans acroporae]